MPLGALAVVRTEVAEAGIAKPSVIAAIHHDLGSACAGALVWGGSARFEGQRVGRGHVVADGDAVEILV